MVGCINCSTGTINVVSKGAIDRNDDLRLVCPASKTGNQLSNPCKEYKH